MIYLSPLSVFLAVAFIFWILKKEKTGNNE